MGGLEDHEAVGAFCADACAGGSAGGEAKGPEAKEGQADELAGSARLDGGGARD